MRAVQAVRPSYSRCDRKKAGTASVPACLYAKIQFHISILSGAGYEGNKFGVSHGLLTLRRVVFEHFPLSRVIGVVSTPAIIHMLHSPKHAVMVLWFHEKAHRRKSWYMVQTPAKTQVLGRASDLRGQNHSKRIVELSADVAPILSVRVMKRAAEAADNFSKGVIKILVDLIGCPDSLAECPVPVQIFSVFQPVFHGLVRDIRKQVCYPPLKIFPGHSVRAPQCPRCSLGPAGRKLSTRIG